MDDGDRLPRPRKHYVFPVVDGRPQFTVLSADEDEYREPRDGYREWYVASVNPEGAKRLQDFANELGAESFLVFTNDQFPIESAVRALDKVGSDRLAAAVAVNQLRDHDRSAIFIDAGTALTVNAISDDGVFLGGAILPGAGTSLAALAKATAQLPKVELDLSDTDEAPPAIGDDTRAAIRSGVYWGLVGAARELIEQMSKQFAGPPQVFVTGGFGPWLSAELTRHAKTDAITDAITEVRCVPHLVLSGVALTAS